MTEREVAFLLLGIAIGLGLYRALIEIILAEPPDTKCAHCQWRAQKKSRHNSNDS